MSNDKLVTKVSYINNKSNEDVGLNEEGGCKRNVELSQGYASVNVFLFSSDCVKESLQYLFRRKAEHVIGMTNIENLIDLFTFSQCSKHIQEIVFSYIKCLVLSCQIHQNETIAFHPDCLQIENYQNAMIVVMIKGLEDNSTYCKLIEVLFKNKFRQYLDGLGGRIIDAADNFADKIDEFIANVSKTLGIILYATKERLLINRIIDFNEILIVKNYNAFSLLVKLRVLILIRALAQNKCLNFNQITTDIVRAIAKLINHNESAVAEYALLAIGELAKSGLLRNGVKSEVIEDILITIEKLLDSGKNNKVLSAALLMIHSFGEAGLLTKTSPERIKSLLLKLETLFNALDWHWETIKNIINAIGALEMSGNLSKVSFQLINKIFFKLEQTSTYEGLILIKNAIWTIGQLARGGRLNDILSLEGKKEMVDKIEEWMTYETQDAELTYAVLDINCNALLTIARLTEAGILKEMPFKRIEKIVAKVEKFLDHEKCSMISCGLLLIGNFGRVGLLKNLESKVIERLVDKAKQLLMHHDWNIVFNAIWSILYIGAVNEFALKTVLNIITEDQVKIINNGIRKEYQNYFEEKKKEDFMKVLIFLSGHSSKFIKNVSNDLMSYIKIM